MLLILSLRQHVQCYNDRYIVDFCRNVSQLLSLLVVLVEDLIMHHTSLDVMVRNNYRTSLLFCDFKLQLRYTTFSHILITCPTNGMQVFPLLKFRGIYVIFHKCIVHNLEIFENRKQVVVLGPACYSKFDFTGKI